MSISLNNIESRVTALEKAGSVIVAQNRNGNNWYVKYNNGLIIQGGYNSMTGGTNSSITINLNTHFSTNGYIAMSQANFALQAGNEGWGVANVISRTVSSFVVKKAFGEKVTIHWMAIGYLVSNRIKSLFKEVISYVDLLK